MPFLLKYQIHSEGRVRKQEKHRPAAVCAMFLHAKHQIQKQILIVWMNYIIEPSLVSGNCFSKWAIMHQPVGENTSIFGVRLSVTLLELKKKKKEEKISKVIKYVWKNTPHIIQIYEQ